MVKNVRLEVFPNGIIHIMKSLYTLSETPKGYVFTNKIIAVGGVLIKCPKCGEIDHDGNILGINGYFKCCKCGEEFNKKLLE